MLINKEWLKNQIKLYRSEYKYYKLYAETLYKILNKACEIYAPHAIVQTRVKSLSSFSEKVIRKAHKYNNPYKEFTDLCGARVITHTQSEVDAICDFIEANFIIDKANSLDVKKRLKKNEFGYLSVHYIVSLPKKPILDILIPSDIGDRKAEIQIRTILQHAWADITHSRIYKSAFIIPEKIEREAARLAAMMENADVSFSNLAKAVDSYQLNYDLHIDANEIQNEIETLQIILENEPLKKNKPLIALKIAKIAKASEDWELIIKTLEPFSNDTFDTNRYVKSEILLELGNSLCRYYKNKTESPQYKKGQFFIKKVALQENTIIDSSLPVTKEEKILRARALSLLAWTYKNSNDRKTAENIYLKAYEYDSKNPYILADCIEFFLHKISYFPLLKQTMLDAINTCRNHIYAGIEVPHAYFTIGRFYFLLQNYSESLNSYIEGIHYCSTHQVPISTISILFTNELEFWKNFKHDKIHSKEHNWIYRILLLSMICLIKDKKALKELKEYSTSTVDFNQPVIIISGDIDSKSQSYNESIKRHLYMALKDFNGTIITSNSAGISGLVKKTIEEFKNTGSTQISLVTYPLEPILNDKLNFSSDYTLGSEDPIQYWIDIVSSGIDPKSITLIGINGGKKSDIEYRLALALGGRTAVINKNNNSSIEILNDEDFNYNKNLISIPMDPMVIKALLMYQKQSSLTKEQLEAAARAVHQNYIETTKPKDPSHSPWECLNENLKNSNRHQVKFCEQILKTCGYGIRPATGENSIQTFTEEEIEKMAKLEHGRWVVERLLDGWKYGEQKDINKKISPYLVSWSKLPDDIKEYDLKAVKNYCSILEKAGLEVFKL